MAASPTLEEHYRRVAPWLALAFGGIPLQATLASGEPVRIAADRDDAGEIAAELSLATIAAEGRERTYLRLEPAAIDWHLARGAVGFAGTACTAAVPGAAAFARIAIAPGDPQAPDVARLGALAVRSGLATLGLGGALVTDGGDGFDVYVPLAGAPAFETLRPALRAFVDRVALEHAELLATERVRGARGDLAIASVERCGILGFAPLPYSVVPRDGDARGVATPLRWSELGTFERDALTVERAGERLAAGDVFGATIAPLRAQRADALLAPALPGRPVLPGLTVRKP